MKKVFILDTNILLSNPNSIFKFEDNDVVIPISVIEEVDHFKKHQDETGRNAREVSRILDNLRKKGTLSSGIPLSDDGKSGLLFVYLGRNLENLPNHLEDTTDNHILAISLTLQKKLGNTRRVSLITKDSNLRIKADAFGIPSEDFEADKVDISHLYTGHKKLQVSAAVLKDFYNHRQISLPDVQFRANEFVIFEREGEERGDYVCGIYDMNLQKVKLIDPYSESVWGVFPRNLEQTFALFALLDDRIKLVTLTGAAGTGKTLMAIASGLAKTTDEDVYQKLMVARPIFAFGKDIGYLPGSVEEKLNPWMQPIYDSLDFLLSGGTSSRQKRLSKSYQELIEQGMLAIEPLTYIRGRSLPNSYFVVDESQNLTPREIKTILTRAGEGTKVVLTGDPYQIDNPYIDSTNNGLTYVVEKFKNAPIAAHVTLTQGERSELATLAAQYL